MRSLLNIVAGLMLAGLVLALAGGMQIRREPDGTWVQVNAVHAIGGGMFLCGALLAVLLLAVASRRNRTAAR